MGWDHDGSLSVLDGGLGSHLESLGHDLTGSLWSAKLLLDNPEAVRSAHGDFFRAGADWAISSSYQVSFGGLQQLGLSRHDATEILRRSVGLAMSARDHHRPGGWVAASVGPYGAALADGSEYRGDYDLDRAGLRAWHEPRLEVLASAGADVLALETLPSRQESLALMDLLRGTGVRAWLSFTMSDGRLRTGESLSESFADANGVDEIVAIGINCSHPSETLGAIRAARSVSDKPIIVYPNSGERWNSAKHHWEGDSGPSDHLLDQWVDAGASIIGGCCRVTPGDIARIASVVRTHAT